MFSAIRSPAWKAIAALTPPRDGRLDDAEVIALDISEEFLDRLREKAVKLGVRDRVRTIRTDLETDWPTVDNVDLAWASSSLHHIADPDRVLADVWEALRPGGRLVVAEMDSFPRFLPDEIGIGLPELEERCHEALSEWRAAQMPHRRAFMPWPLCVVPDRPSKVDWAQTI
jgi:SAM-dependent methyltransferase